MRVAIIGAGAGGLAAAYDLRKTGADVVLFEGAARVGGLAAGFKTPEWDWTVENYYHHWFASDKAMLDLIQELGMADQVLFPWPITAVYHDGHFYPLDGPLSLIFSGLPWLDRLPGVGTIARVLHLFRFPALSILDKLRYGLAAFYLLVAPSWKPFERVTAYAWLTRWMGPRCMQHLWEPLLVGKFGDHYKDINMAWFWARVKARTPRLGTFRGGFQRFMDAFAEVLAKMGVDIRLDTPVQSIRSVENGLEIVLNTGGERFDQCLVTTSPNILERLAPDLPDHYLARLRELNSMGAVVLILALRHRLSEQGVYWHNLPKSAGFPFLALVEHTNYLSPGYFGGDHIVYCGDYLDPDHEYFRLTKEEILARFLPQLNRFNANFSPDWVKDTWLFRTPYAQPVPPVNHSRSIPALRTPIPGLWFASMSQVYPWDRGTNFAVKIGRQAVREMLAEHVAGEDHTSG
jgi:protoporphyrinogen oxidase